MSETLDLSGFRDALAELARMELAARNPEIVINPELSAYLRTAVIKGFEYSYEMAHKSMRRFVSIYVPAEKTDFFADLLRTMLDLGLIADEKLWLRFRERRNITSHIYRRAKAEEVYAVVPEFLVEAQRLLSIMQSRVDARP